MNIQNEVRDLLQRKNPAALNKIEALLNTPKIAGNWNKLLATLKEKYGELSDSDWEEKCKALLQQHAPKKVSQLSALLKLDQYDSTEKLYLALVKKYGDVDWLYCCKDLLKAHDELPQLETLLSKHNNDSEVLYLSLVNKYSSSSSSESDLWITKCKSILTQQGKPQQLSRLLQMPQYSENSEKLYRDLVKKYSLSEDTPSDVHQWKQKCEAILEKQGKVSQLPTLLQMPQYSEDSEKLYRDLVKKYSAPEDKLSTSSEEHRWEQKCEAILEKQGKVSQLPTLLQMPQYSKDAKKLYEALAKKYKNDENPEDDWKAKCESLLATHRKASQLSTLLDIPQYKNNPKHLYYALLEKYSPSELPHSVWEQKAVTKVDHAGSTLIVSELSNQYDIIGEQLYLFVKEILNYFKSETESRQQLTEEFTTTRTSLLGQSDMHRRNTEELGRARRQITLTETSSRMELETVEQQTYEEQLLQFSILKQQSTPLDNINKDSEDIGEDIDPQLSSLEDVAQEEVDSRYDIEDDESQAMSDLFRHFISSSKSIFSTEPPPPSAGENLSLEDHSPTPSSRDGGVDEYVFDTPSPLKGNVHQPIQLTTNNSPRDGDTREPRDGDTREELFLSPSERETADSDIPLIPPLYDHRLQSNEDVVVDNIALDRPRELQKLPTAEIVNRSPQMSEVVAVHSPPSPSPSPSPSSDHNIDNRVSDIQDLNSSQNIKTNLIEVIPTHDNNETKEVMDSDSPIQQSTSHQLKLTEETLQRQAALHSDDDHDREPSPQIIDSLFGQVDLTVTNPVVEESREKLIKLFKIVNKDPEDIIEKKVDAMMKHYEGRESDLLAAVERKYGTVSDGINNDNDGDEEESVEKLSLRDKLVLIFSKENPENERSTNEAKSDTVLRYYEGREDELISAMRIKFGDYADEVFGTEDKISSTDDDNSSESSIKADSSLRDKLLRLYGRVNQNDVSTNEAQVDTMMQHYEGREEDLIAAIEAKHGPLDLPDYQRYLKKVYKKYDPDKIASVDIVLDQYQGREPDLFTALATRYADSSVATIYLGKKSPAEIPKEGANSSFLERLQALKEGDSSFIADPESLLAKYEGYEEQLVSKLEEKYQTEQKLPENAVVQLTVIPTRYRNRLDRFYSLYAKDKLPTVDSTLRTYKGKEEDLFDMLVATYGPEPLASESCTSSDYEEEPDDSYSEEEGDQDPESTLLNKIMSSSNAFQGRPEELKDAIRRRLNASNSNTKQPLEGDNLDNGNSDDDGLLIPVKPVCTNCGQQSCDCLSDAKKKRRISRRRTFPHNAVDYTAGSWLYYRYHPTVSTGPKSWKRSWFSLQSGTTLIRKTEHRGGRQFTTPLKKAIRVEQYELKGEAPPKNRCQHFIIALTMDGMVGGRWYSQLVFCCENMEMKRSWMAGFNSAIKTLNTKQYTTATPIIRVHRDDSLSPRRNPCDSELGYSQFYYQPEACPRWGSIRFRVLTDYLVCNSDTIQLTYFPLSWIISAEWCRIGRLCPPLPAQSTGLRLQFAKRCVFVSASTRSQLQILKDKIKKLLTNPSGNSQTVPVYASIATRDKYGIPSSLTSPKPGNLCDSVYSGSWEDAAGKLILHEAVHRKLITQDEDFNVDWIKNGPPEWVQDLFKQEESSRQLLLSDHKQDCFRIEEAALAAASAAERSPSPKKEVRLLEPPPSINFNPHINIKGYLFQNYIIINNLKSWGVALPNKIHWYDPETLDIRGTLLLSTLTVNNSDSSLLLTDSSGCEFVISKSGSDVQNCWIEYLQSKTVAT